MSNQQRRRRPRRPENLLRVTLAALLLASACSSHESENLAQLTGGDPRHGAVAIRQYGCGSCHTIEGIRGADGLVGPPLTGIAQRAYIAGVLTNTPENLVRWIQNPPAIDPKTAMPNVGVTYRDAKDIAGYLYTRQ